MGKYKDANYCQVYNGAIALLNKHNHRLPFSTRWLYAHLCYLEHRLTGRKTEWFFRSHGQLAQDIGASEATVKRGLKTLKQQKLIETAPMHWIDPKTKKKSEKHVNAIWILSV